MHKGFLLTAAILGAVSVGLGAFGAHGLKQIVAPETVASFETGVRYQFYHVFALLAIGILFEKSPDKWMRWSGNCFIIGIILFSGSLYAMTVMDATEMVGKKSIGIITPLGGIFFLIGWLLLFFTLMKKRV